MFDGKPIAMTNLTALSGRVLPSARKNAVVIVFFALFLTMSILSPAFFSARNLANVLDQSVQVGLVACGATLAIISGGFDLSVGAIFAITGVVSCVVANQSGTPLGVATGVAVGLLLGVFNGVIVAVLRINSFIATLSTSLMIMGVGNLFVRGQYIAVAAQYFDFLGRQEFLGLKHAVYVFVIFIAFSWLVLSRTTLGRQICAVGGNAEAARLSGVRVTLVRILAFTLSGLGAGLAGTIAVSRVSVGLMAVGSTLPLDAIAAVVIGGTSIMGGEGAIWRTVLGVLLLRILANGFNIIGVEPFYQQFFQGLIIIAAVALDTLSRKES